VHPPGRTGTRWAIAVLLSLVAAGLNAFDVYSLSDARYRRI